jgi:hypothetical protein
MIAPAPRIRTLTTQPPATLHITWSDGGQTRHDLAGMVRTEAWAAALRDPTVFQTAEVLDDGWRVAWPGTEAELSAQGLWDDIHPPPAVPEWMSAADFTAWMQEMAWSFAQAAEALGVSKRMLKYYAAGTHPIPKPVWLACMHLAADRRRRELPVAASAANGTSRRGRPAPAPGRAPEAMRRP